MSFRGLYFRRLSGAIIWNIITWIIGLPTSSSHALIGGLMGAGLSAAGIAAIHWSTIELVLTFMILSPLIGLTVGFAFMAVVLWFTRSVHKITADSYFKKLQLCSAAAYSLSHGTNDAQKTMGIITPLLFSIGYYGATVNAEPSPGATLGHSDLLCRNCPWHAFRRVADCKNHGL